jgi:hypothetical protein
MNTGQYEGVGPCNIIYKIYTGKIFRVGPYNTKYIQERYYLEWAHIIQNIYRKDII